MSVLQESFLRRYATTPIHVARLERLLTTYGPAGSEDEFAQRFIVWDDACGDGEAARITTEILSQLYDAEGNLVRLTDETVRAAIDWVAAGNEREREDRIAVLRSTLFEASRLAAAENGKVYETSDRSGVS